MAGQDRRHVLGVQIALDARLHQIAQSRRGHRAGADNQAGPERPVQEQSRPERTGREAGNHRPAKTLPGLFRADRWRHRVVPEQDPGEVATRVAARGQDHEEKRPVRTIRLGEQERDEHSHRRQVEQRERARCHVS
jgi:hypothetical protein